MFRYNSKNTIGFRIIKMQHYVIMSERKNWLRTRETSEILINKLTFTNGHTNRKKYYLLDRKTHNIDNCSLSRREGHMFYEPKISTIAKSKNGNLSDPTNKTIREF